MSQRLTEPGDFIGTFRTTAIRFCQKPFGRSPRSFGTAGALGENGADDSLTTLKGVRSPSGPDGALGERGSRLGSDGAE